MRQILDLHIHSKYSRACSQNLTLENIEKTCRTKGVDIIATSDFTHPLWFREIKNNLEEIGQSGLYQLKGSDGKIKFIFSTEISCIYSKGGKVRRLHIVTLAPNFKAAEKINQALGKIGNLSSDGRPILGLDAKKLVRIVLNIDPNCLVIPAHAWTPWFAVFGSKSGFDSLAECFEEETANIYSIETGLSSDPSMNWRLSALDKITLVSNSDAHSLPNIGREANIFELENLTYQDICQTIKTKDKKKFIATIEFYPEEGMYHFDGHRLCGVSFSPEETKKRKNICPVCKKPLTIGVMNRVTELADRPKGFKPKNAIGYYKLIGLDKIIAETLNIKSRTSRAVKTEYDNLIQRGGNEMKILLDLSMEEIKKIAGDRLAEAIERVRQGNLIIEPGFDGSYGKIKIFSGEKETKKQKKLF